MADQPRQRGRPRLSDEERARRAQIHAQHRLELLQHNRQDEDFVEEERERNRQRQAAARVVDAVRVEANSQNAARRRNARAANPAQAAAAQAVNTQQHRNRRQDPVIQAAEQAVNNQQHRNRRQDPVVRAAEQAVNSQQRAARREDPVAEMREEERRLWRTLNAAEAQYEIDISDGPIHVCSCCVKLIWRTSIDKTINIRIRFPASWDFDFVNFHCPLDARVDADTLQLCFTCVKYLKRRRLPPFCFSTFRLPVIPPLLSNASRIALRMASRRIAFMHIKKLGYDGQLGIRGNVINVPIDVQVSVDILPRNFNQMETIQVRLKRRRGDGHAYIFETVRPQEVVDIVRYMIANSPLYEGVTFDDRWQANHPGDEVDFVVNPADAIPPADAGNEEADPEEGDQWDEAANEPDFGGEAVLLQDENVLAAVEAAVQYAPGDGQRPVGIFADPQAEGLTFINLYGGQLPPSPPGTTIADRFKTEVMHRDPRFRTDTTCLFWKNAVLTQYKIASQIGIALRQGRLQGQQITAQNLLNQQNIENFVRHDMGYRVLLNARNSPPFWELKTKEGMAMLRTLGAPTFFLTLSPVEKLCPELLVNLCKARDPASQITGAEALNMEDREKAELIANDPTDASPFYPHTVSDYLRRTEFQHRGSPHVHTMLWTTNRMAPGEQAGPPQYQPDDPDSEAACVEFIDQYMTCSSTAVPEELLRFQKHRHTFSCRKMRNRNQETCRFGFPRFPMRATRILDPLPDEQKNQEQADHLARIKAKLAEYWRTVRAAAPIADTFEEYLQELQMTDEQYIMAIRQSLDKNRSKIFLRRSPAEVNINNYNIRLLRLHRANMDIQFVLDPFACVKYILSYINKANRGMSKLLRETVAEITARGNVTIREKLKIIAKKFLNSSEISAQEAVFYLLALEVSKTSRDDEFAWCAQKGSYGNLPPNSTDVFSTNINDYYRTRPRAMADLALAQVAANFSFKKKARVAPLDDDDDDDDDDEAHQQAFMNVFGIDADELARQPANGEANIDFEAIFDAVLADQVEVDNGAEIDVDGLHDAVRGAVADDRIDVDAINDALDNADDEDDQQADVPEENDEEFNCPVVFHRRRRPRFLRWHRYSQVHDRANYVRMMLLLFHPWRIEPGTDPNQDLEATFRDHREEIFNIFNQFSPGDNEEQLDADFRAEEERQRLEEEEPQPEQAVADGFAHLDPPEEIEHENVSQQIGLQGERAPQAPNLEPPPRHEQYRMPTIWEYEVFLARIALLNRRQRKILLNVMHRVKTGAPFHLFITGGAGVGKSFLIECIYQAAMRYYDHQPNVELDKLKVLLCAPTGKAAFNIRGMTLHSAFGIPVSQNNNNRPLSADIANTLRVTFSQLKLIIIDEVSMVGLSMLSKVDTRLRQIMGVDELYGNLPVIVLGDFNQLRPVMDRFAFQPFGGDRALAGTVLWDPFSYFRLDQVMRQENAVFAQALNNLAVGRLTPAEVALFEGRVIQPFERP
ncbi:hypothetical protein TYRP_018746 [Tyrophagus putrescentiae]|nr:hypothetical protein TYRP_018746 [Tyrophagus putrescentiae]